MIRYSDNIRGEIVFQRNPELFHQDKPFSVVIFDGKGELFFKRVNGAWHERILSFDRCFGVMYSRWRGLNIKE